MTAQCVKRWQPCVSAAVCCKLNVTVRSHVSSVSAPGCAGLPTSRRTAAAGRGQKGVGDQLQAQRAGPSQQEKLSSCVLHIHDSFQLSQPRTCLRDHARQLGPVVGPRLHSLQLPHLQAGGRQADCWGATVLRSRCGREAKQQRQAGLCCSNCRGASGCPCSRCKCSPLGPISAAHRQH